MSGFDVIGDIHGHANALERLLERLDYAVTDGVYRHPSRVAIFAGDFIDRGPEQIAVLRVARVMVEAGTARAVMGNHELNAIAWATPDGRGGFLRARTEKNNSQHRAFLEQIGEASDAHASALDWFRSLPLWLDLGDLRVVHACWHRPSQEALAGYVDDHARLTARGVHAIHDRGSEAFKAAEVLVKGPEAALPQGCSFNDKDGNLRNEARLRWWDESARTFRKAALGMEGHEEDLPDEPIPLDYTYTDRIPVLFGHYWMCGVPRVLNPLASCQDFSVAKKEGYLTAYRWSGEQELQSSNLVWVRA